jgi:hypothetical protein
MPTDYLPGRPPLPLGREHIHNSKAGHECHGKFVLTAPSILYNFVAS